MNQEINQQTTASDELLCQSVPADMKPVYLMYAVITAIVVTFQLFVFFRNIFNVVQILIVTGFLVSVVYYLIKTKREAAEYLYLYKNHYETRKGSFRYQDIQDMDTGKHQLLLKTEKKTTYYVANAEELTKIIRKCRAESRSA